MHKVMNILNVTNGKFMFKVFYPNRERERENDVRVTPRFTGQSTRRKPRPTIPVKHRGDK